MDDNTRSNQGSPKRKIECKPELIIANLQKFYSSRQDVDKILPYLTGDSIISLRIIDWFVTKYSRKNFIKYDLNGKDFLIYLSYKGQLKAYSKQYFDPNCRRERIMFTIHGNKTFLTTIGKLKFFAWALENKVVDYIEKNINTIRTEYNIYLKESSTQQTKNPDNISNTLLTNITSTKTDNTTTYVCTLTTTRATRRRMKQIPSSLHHLQISSSGQINLSFN